MTGKKTRGRRRIHLLHDLMVNSNYATLKQTAAERLLWRHDRVPALQQKTRDITSTADELSGGTNIDDLERP